MALTVHEKKIVRVMIREGVDDDTIDAMGSDDVVAREKIDEFKLEQLIIIDRHIDMLEKQVGIQEAQLVKLNAVKVVLNKDII